MGPRLPPRIPRADRIARTLPQRAAHRADRHGRCADAARDRRAAGAGTGSSNSSPASTAPTSATASRRKTMRASSCRRFSKANIPTMRASSIACRARKSKRPQPGSRSRAGMRCPITPVWIPPRAARTRNASCARKASSWSPPSRSAWASTSPTCASSRTSICPKAWKAIIRKPAVPDATACPRMRGWPTAWAMSCRCAR